MFNRILSTFFLILPSFLKIIVLKLYGNNIGRNVRIGFTWMNLNGKYDLGNFTRIGHLNIVNVKALTMERGSKIGSFNWISGLVSEAGLRLGMCSSIRRFHYLDTTGGISIGSNSIIAGRGSVLFTHGLSPVNLDFQKGIEIGDWVYIGAKVNILPGAQIARGIFVGMGSTVVGTLSEEYSVYVSAKAAKIKTFDRNDVYYDRPYIIHKHLKNVQL